MQGTAAISEGSGDYQIEKSLRFDSTALPVLKRTLGSGDTRRYTFSFWLKRGKGWSGGALFSTSTNTSGSDPRTDWQILQDQLLIAFNPTGSSWIEFKPARLLRDHSSWYHICVAVDSTQKISNERVKIYINGVEETEYTTYGTISQNTALIQNSAQEHHIGQYKGGTNHLSAYLADVHFISGLALSAAAFGSFDAAGIFNPKEFALPTPNTTAGSPTWSSMCSGTVYNSNHPYANAFDGDP